MTDLIERLRTFEGSDALGNGDFSLLHEAATEIEALRAEAEKLRADLMESDELREKLRQRLMRTATALKGEPPEGTWHSWHDLPEKATQLVERAQRDEALLRQALEALEFFRDTAICEADTAVSTDAIAALRERLDEGGRNDLRQGDQP